MSAEFESLLNQLHSITQVLDAAGVQRVLNDPWMKTQIERMKLHSIIDLFKFGALFWTAILKLQNLPSFSKKLFKNASSNEKTRFNKSKESSKLLHLFKAASRSQVSFWFSKIVWKISVFFSKRHQEKSVLMPTLSTIKGKKISILVKKLIRV